MRVREAIALHLGLDRDFVNDTVRDGKSVMRLLHYPPLSPDAPEGAIRAAAHGDINTITLLLGAEEAGLELLTKEGVWKAVDVPEGALVINVGDMLDRLTNSRLRSTTHRVVNQSGDRKSVVEGKSVSVSVDCGGRSILKQKHKLSKNKTTDNPQKQ